MKLRTLEGITNIGDYKVGDDGFIRIEGNTISFTIQSAPVKEVGVNGCQVDTLIEAARLMLLGLNKEVKCVENKLAASYLCSALRCLRARERDRIKRGVEGTSQE